MENAPMSETQRFLDHRAIDWPQVRRATYLVRQSVEYRYPSPIADLQQRLMLIPRLTHGDQRLVACSLEVATSNAPVTGTRDRFGNRVHHVAVSRVDGAIRFDARFTVERRAGSTGVPCTPATARRYLPATPLTAPDDTLRRAARELRVQAHTGLSLATAIAGWVRRTVEYRPDVTTVRTSAGEALAQGSGVCQDFAHIVLALCRLCDLPARYVSGHRLGDGHTHAWAEVIVPDPARPGAFRAVAFDSTRNRPVDLTYITVAVGRDYRDVAPTTGTFRAAHGGRLHATKSARVLSVEFQQDR
jgi:transglutaminase-like putative cysteine protease